MEKVYNAAAAKAGGGMKGRMFSWAAKQARALSKASAYVDSPLPESAVAGPGPDTTPIPDASAMPSPGPSTVLRLRGRIADALVLSKVRAILARTCTPSSPVALLWLSTWRISIAVWVSRSYRATACLRRPARSPWRPRRISHRTRWASPGPATA